MNPKLLRPVLLSILLLTCPLIASAQILPPSRTTPPLPGMTSNIVVRGPGGANCAVYLSSPTADRGLFIAWVQGFLTSYNQYVMQTGDIAGNLSNEQIIQGLDNYCRTYPQDSFHTAMSKLIEAFKGVVR